VEEKGLVVSRSYQCKPCEEDGKFKTIKVDLSTLANVKRHLKVYSTQMKVSTYYQLFKHKFCFPFRINMV